METRAETVAKRMPASRAHTLTPTTRPSSPACRREYVEIRVKSYKSAISREFHVACTDLSPHSGKTSILVWSSLNRSRKMSPDEFRASLLEDAPPHQLSASLAALWWDAKGDLVTRPQSH